MLGLSASDHHQYVFDTYRQAFNVLTGTKDLSPRNADVNKSLSAFVRAVLDCECHVGCDLLSDNEVQAIRRPMLEKLAEAEFQMEKFYARPDRLAHFPYHENYRNLVREEIQALRLLNRPIMGPTFFIGSGPLPLTAIEFALQTKCPVICVERDGEAVRLSRNVIKQYGLQDKVAVIEGDGAAMNYDGAGLVMVAALAAGKDDLMHQIQKTAPEALLGVRSAEGLRTLLYDEIDSRKIERHGYSFGGKSRTNSDIINTTLMFCPA